MKNTNQNYDVCKSLMENSDWNYARAFSEVMEKQRRDNVTIKFLKEN